MGISIGNKLELVFLEDVIRNVPNRKVYVSKIYDILNNNSLQIAMPIYEGKIVPLSVGDKYSVCFYTDKGLLQCNAVVLSRYKDGNLFFLEIGLIGELNKVQRREFYRYNCVIDAKIRIVSDEEYETGVHEDMSIPESELEWFDSKIVDISGGGVRLLCKHGIEKNEVVKIKFLVTILDEIVSINLFARILSNRFVQGRTDVYEQRLEFMKITQDDRDKIIKFIFESERVHRAKETGLI